MSENTGTKKTAAAAKPAEKKYEAVHGLSFGKDGRNEPGDEYTGPKESVEWLLEQGWIKEA